MTFHDVRLPDDIERGAVGGPGFKTRILILESGFEQRNIDWSQTRGEWDISYGLMSMDDNDLDTYIHLVRDFFYVRRGRAIGFRFKDWSDFQIPDTTIPATTSQDIALGDDATVDFQIFKRYISLESYDRVIKKIVDGTVSVFLDGALQTDPAQYTIDLTTGIITFVIPPASTGGTGPGGEQVVAVACQFDVPVRFDDDEY